MRNKYAGQSEGEDQRRTKEQIEYIAALLLELKEMARNNRLTTLAGILEVAHTEACMRAKDYR